jgi:aspartyl-tRNA(Asn)/glutamyl-tRNA(Gln) amidotransferase subunit C
MSLSIEEVQKIARLARIVLTSEEEQRYAKTISAVLAYMDILNEVQVDGVEPTAQVTGLHNVMRADVVVESDIKQALIAQMPQVEQNELVVPAVFAEEV